MWCMIKPVLGYITAVPKAGAVDTCSSQNLWAGTRFSYQNFQLNMVLGVASLKA